VKTLVQDNRKLADSSGLDDQQFKRIDYDYDLISGATRQVSYQRDSVDAFHHKYEYDADSRITAAYTSNHPDPDINADVLWDNDAKYFYYVLGDLARIEIGDNQIQGIDYVYTLLGFYKNVNSNTLDSLRDPGRDGYRDSSNVHFNFPKDVFGFSLGYYSGDYSAIDTSKNGVNSPMASLTGSDLENYRYNLYNGNVSSMVTTITNPTTREVLPIGNAYRYDQLNRLVEARSFYNLNFSTNQWQNAGIYARMYYNGFSYDANGNILGQLRKDHAGSVIDSLTYHYAKNSNDRIIQNRLYHVNDTADYNGNDIDDMGVFDSDLSVINSNNNYKYTEIGELKSDAQEEIEEIQWTVRGKIKAILRPDSSNKKEFVFDYDARDQRIAKHVYSSSGVWEKSTYYIRDFSGNILSVYDYTYDDSTATMSYALKEQNIYGSSRLGYRKDSIEMIGSYVDSVNFERTLGKKNYELINHLGNVLSIVSDKKIPVDDNTDGTVDRYLAEIISANDYSPFGVILEERNFNSSGAINGFNGARKDDDVKGEGNSYDFSFRVYDSRLGRFYSVDPFASNYSYNSTYAFAENRVIEGLDQEGLEFAPGVVPRFKSHPVINNNPGLPESKPLGVMYQDWYPEHETQVPNSKRNPTRVWCSSCQSGSGNSNGKPGYSFVQMGQWQSTTVSNTTIATTITPPTTNVQNFQNASTIGNAFRPGTNTPTAQTIQAVRAAQRLANTPPPPTQVITGPTVLVSDNTDPPSVSADGTIITQTNTQTSQQTTTTTTFQNVVYISFNTTKPSADYVDPTSGAVASDVLQQRFDALAASMGNPTNLVYNPAGNQYGMTTTQMGGSVNQTVISTGTVATTTSTTNTTTTTTTTTQTFDFMR